ncbi:hypothetical protein JXA88_16575 [Candidatus Fermentibacteria bacterium]|nr:hypothetical protein [Candidatus Fermentibacteria bacterium]
MTLEQIREAGLKALSRELGPVGLVRFIQQFEPGTGDYTRERHAWLEGVSLDELVRQAERSEGEDTRPQ